MAAIFVSAQAFSTQFKIIIDPFFIEYDSDNFSIYIKSMGNYIFSYKGESSDGGLVVGYEAQRYKNSR